MIFLCELFQEDQTDQALRLVRRKSVKVWIEMVETLYRYPLDRSDAKLKDELVIVMAKMRGKLRPLPARFDGATATAAEYEALYEEIAVVRAKIVGDSPTKIPADVGSIKTENTDI